MITKYSAALFASLVLLISGCQSTENESVQSTQKERVVRVALNDGAAMPSPEQQVRLISLYRASEHIPDNVPIRLEFEKYQPNPAIPRWSDMLEAVLAKYHTSEKDIAYAPRELSFDAPMYPYKMRVAHKDGMCEFVFTVSPDGVPANIYLVQASAMEFAEHAEYSLKRWRFPSADAVRLMRIRFDFSGGTNVTWRKE